MGFGGRPAPQILPIADIKFPVTLLPLRGEGHIAGNLIKIRRLVYLFAVCPAIKHVAVLDERIRGERYCFVGLDIVPLLWGGPDCSVSPIVFDSKAGRRSLTCIAGIAGRPNGTAGGCSGFTAGSQEQKPRC